MAAREPDGYNGTVKTTQWSVWPTWESWNWRGHEGKPIEVEVITRHPRVRLYLNGKVVGEHSMSASDGLRKVFTIPYQPGTVTATGMDADGNEIESVNLTTAGAPRALRLTPDRQVMTAANQDLIFITAEIVDRNGNTVPDADMPLTFSVSGPGSIIATGNADLKSTEPYSTPITDTWKGRALVIIRSTGRPGTVTLTASTPTLGKKSVKLKSTK